MTDMTREEISEGDDYILVCFPSMYGQTIHMAQWTDLGGLDGPEWFLVDGSNPSHEPTHWMPLPTPPTQAKEKSDGS